MHFSLIYQTTKKPQMRKRQKTSRYIYSCIIFLISKDWKIALTSHAVPSINRRIFLINSFILLKIMWKKFKTLENKSVFFTRLLTFGLFWSKTSSKTFAHSRTLWTCMMRADRLTCVDRSSQIFSVQAMLNYVMILLWFSRVLNFFHMIIITLTTLTFYTYNLKSGLKLYHPSPLFIFYIREIFINTGVRAKQ